MARIFFFTSLSGFHLHARTTRNLASKQTPTIMEFPRAFNEEPLQPFERSAVRASEARILAAALGWPANGRKENPEGSGGGRMPAKKTYHLGDLAPVLPDQSGGLGKWEVGPGGPWQCIRA